MTPEGHAKSGPAPFLGEKCATNFDISTFLVSHLDLVSSVSHPHNSVLEIRIFHPGVFATFIFVLLKILSSSGPLSILVMQNVGNDGLFLWK